MSLGRVPIAGTAHSVGPGARWGPEGGDPGRLPQLLSRGSVNWLGRPAAPRSYRLARGHRHAPTPGTGARVYTHTQTHAQTHAPTATKRVCCREARSRGALWPRKGPGGRRLCAQRVPSARAAPAPLPAPAAASRPAPAAPRLASGCAVNPRSPRPAARRARPSARPSAVARSGAAPCAHPAGVPSAAGRPGRAQQRGGDPGRPTPGRAPQGDRGVAARGASAAAPPGVLRLWRAGRGGGGGGAEGGPREPRRRRPPSSSASFFSAGST